MPKKKTLDEKIDELARAVNRGFDETATKGDIKRVDTRIDKVDERIGLVVDNLDIMRQDIHDIKITLGPLVRTVAALDSEVVGLRRRMERVEKRIGIVR